MWIKIFYVNNITEKVICSVFYVYIFDFITYFYNTPIIMKLLLIHYLCNAMVMNIFVLLDILSNISCQQCYSS